MPDFSIYTAQLPVADQFSCWKETVCEQFMHLECQEKNRSRIFDASVELSNISNYSVANLKSGAHEVTRSHAMISRDHKKCYYINYQKSGHCLVTDSIGSQNIVNAGEAFIVCSEEYFKMDFDSRFEHFVVEIPYADLNEDILQPITYLSPKNIEDRLILGAFSIIEQQFNQGIDDFNCELFLKQYTTLLNTKIDSNESQRIIQRLSGKVNSEAIKQHIGLNITDTKLSIDSVAKHFQCSRRTIFRCFQAEGISLNQYISKQRIELSKVLFSQLPKASILEICHRSGFEDSSHFSKKFREHIGMSPREYRKFYI